MYALVKGMHILVLFSQLSAAYAGLGCLVGPSEFIEGVVSERTVGQRMRVRTYRQQTSAGMVSTEVDGILMGTRTEGGRTILIFEESRGGNIIQREVYLDQIETRSVQTGNLEGVDPVRQRDLPDTPEGTRVTEPGPPSITARLEGRSVDQLSQMVDEFAEQNPQFADHIRAQRDEVMGRLRGNWSEHHGSFPEAQQAAEARLRTLYEDMAETRREAIRVRNALEETGSLPPEYHSKPDLESQGWVEGEGATPAGTRVGGDPYMNCPPRAVLSLADCIARLEARRPFTQVEQASRPIQGPADRYIEVDLGPRRGSSRTSYRMVYSITSDGQRQYWLTFDHYVSFTRLH